jgi:hypothetical protein
MATLLLIKVPAGKVAVAYEAIRRSMPRNQRANTCDFGMKEPATKEL